MLSDANRLKILQTLEGQQLSVSQIIENIGLPQTLVSFHLKALREAGLIKTYRKGTFVFNELCDEELISLIQKFEKYRTDKEGKSWSSFCLGPPWMHK